MALGVDGDIMRPGQVLGLRASRPELEDEFPIEAEDEDAGGLVVHDHQLSRLIDRNSLRT